MGPDLELKAKSNLAMEILIDKGNEIIPKDLEDNLVQSISQYEDKTVRVEPLHTEQAKVLDGSGNMEVNITDSTESDGNGQLEGRCEDASESMSSFGDTVSETENGASMSDPEIESRLCVGDAQTLTFHQYDRPFQLRKKKLTDHWRRFIRPLTWRCKWLELQIKECQSQARKYDREIEENEQRKRFDFDTFLVEGFDTKSLQFSSCMRRKKVMKRKKRERLEVTSDIASYMSRHNLFSYYEKKKSVISCATVDDNRANLDKLANSKGEFVEGWPSLEPSGDDSICEHFLRKIEVVQSQVHKLRARIDTVISENPGKFVLVDSMSSLAQVDSLVGSVYNVASPPENEVRKPARSLSILSRHVAECDLGDLMYESDVSRHGLATPLADTVESTGQTQIVAICESAGGRDHQIHHQAAKQEIRDYRDFGRQLADALRAPMEMPTLQASEADLPTETFVSHPCHGEKSLPTSRSNITSKKRKRGKRKSGASGWNKTS